MDPFNILSLNGLDIPEDIIFNYSRYKCKTY